MNNPLTEDILQQLTRYPGGISEYQLLKELEAHPVMQKLDAAGELLLFQKHFLLMNGLYQIELLCQSDSLMANRLLLISPLQIQLLDGVAITSLDTAVGPADSPELRDYYLQWSNLFDMDEAGVEQLLESFWVQYHDSQARGEALLTLQLSVEATDLEISRQYRKLAFQHHPDRGGDDEAFIRIRQAYEVLAVSMTKENK